MSLDEGPQDLRRGNLRCLLHGIILEGNINDPNREMKLKGELMFSRIILEGRVQGESTSRVQYASNWSLCPCT